jgi:hypothetical protein
MVFWIARVVARERPVLEYRIAEQIGRRHRHNQAVILQSLFKARNDVVALARRGIDRHEIIVMEIHPICPDFTEHIGDLHRRDRLAHRPTKRIATNVSHRPKPKREFQFLIRSVISHGSVPFDLKLCGAKSPRNSAGVQDAKKR